MAGLNKHQSAAVETLSGPLLVLAGAGTGKTRVVTFRIANLIRHGIAADRILAVTFTNKAANEMRERIAHQLRLPKRVKRGDPPIKKPVIGTFHSICVQVLKRNATRLGYPQAFTIYDRGDCESLARSVLRELRLNDAMISPSDFLSIVGRWKSNGVSMADAQGHANSDKEHLAASGYARYQRALKLCGAFDFDDLLLCTETLFREHKDVRDAEAGRFDHILVDEYQDTNASQYQIISYLADKHQNLCVVGDDDQSIYGWRGAEVKHILNFRKSWPKAVVVRLEDNYRSTDAILKAANALIAFNSERHDKVLRAARPNGKPPRVLPIKDDLEEAKFVASEIANRLTNEKNLEPRDFAILFRTNEQPRVLETELRNAKLPYTLTGTQSFFDRKEIRDVLAYMKWISSPEDEVALLRMINTPSRGIGQSTVEKLLNSAVRSGSRVWKVINGDTALVSSFPKPAQSGIRQLQTLHKDYQQIFAGDMVAATTSLIDEIRYEDEIRRNYHDPDEVSARIASLQELVNAVAQYSEDADEPSLSDFLTSMTLDGRDFGSKDEQKNARNAISLMTYHSAKGLEFPIVYMVGMEEGLLPHRRSTIEDTVDEERRLCYVGVTRAQEELTLSLALARKKWGKDRPTFPSRFLYELTGQADNPNRLRSIQGAKDEARATMNKPQAGKAKREKSAKKPA
jgi:DNA helicase-2/ATP-dependent DNA helicase PcrA